MIGIYKIESKDGSIYIGSSIDIERRVSTHRWNLRRNKHHNPHLQNAWNKHGEDYFMFAVLENANNEASLVIREQYWLDYIFANIPATKIYNVRRTAENNNGMRHSEETKVRIRLSNIGKKRSVETRHRQSIAQRKTHTKDSYNRKAIEAMVLANRKTYKFVSPDGRIVVITNIKRFCKDNNLNAGHLNSVANGKRKSHRGWTKY